MIVVHGVGPAYWGIERELSDTALLTRAWLVQDLPPFRRSTHGYRIRFWRDHALHFGLCRYAEDPHKRLRYHPHDIGRWGRDQEADEDGAAQPVEAGSAES